ncbi:hypothetical protein HD806DRAFT_463951 [Xylariaceae sp. AK1471]|nr:hypothetical protein HD806DRAFT_463951 [Xylariaceae sp. AK1471]
MAELPEQESLYAISGEKPYSGDSVRAEVSPPSGAQPRASGSQSLFPPLHVDEGLSDDILPPAASPRQLLTLLKLPLEIRLEIYEHLLTVPSNRIASSSSPPTPQTSPGPLHPNILRTCRQLHAESILILYRSNTFLAHTSLLTTFPSFFSPIHPRKTYAPIRNSSLAALVTRFRVRIRLDAEPRFTQDEVAAQFSGKSEVVVEAWQAEWRGAGPDVLRLFEGVRGVRVAKVTGSTSGFEEYARWLGCTMMAGVGDDVMPYTWKDGNMEGPIRD